MIKILLILTILEGIVLGPLRIGWNLEENIYSIIFVFFNFLIVMGVLAREHLSAWFYKTIFVIYSIKILLLIFIYFDVDVVMNALSIRDVYGFFQPQAIDYMHGSMNRVIQIYSKIVAYIYIVFGPIMRIPVFYNVMASLLADVFFYKILLELKINSKHIKIFSILFMLLPWRNVQSMFMVRESFPTFLVVLSIYYFVKWWESGNGANFVYSIINAILSMIFHSGLIAIAVVMMIVYILYNPRKRQWIINFKTACKFGAIMLSVGVILALFGDMILNKFTLAFSGDEALSNWNDLVVNGADSVYLSNLPYTNFDDVILQSPLRLLYFLFSPMPWNLRGISDVLAFGFDSLLLLLGVTFSLVNMKRMTKTYKKLIKVLLCMYFLTALIFGAGTFDSGTAMRHRAKFTSILLIVDAMTITGVMQNKISSKVTINEIK